MRPSTFSRDALKPRQPKGMGRGFWLAVLVHVGLVIAIAFGVSWRSREPEGVSAELWSAVPQQAAPRAVEPTPAPTPPPEPPPPPPKPAPVEPAPPPPRPDPQIAIEKEKAEREKQRKLEEEREREALKKKQLAEKQRQEAEALKKKQLAEQQRREAEEKKREAAEEARLAELRKRNLERMMGQAGATGDERSTGTAQQSSGPSASYAGRIKARIKPNIVFPDDLPSNPTAEVEVRAGPDGTILGRRLIKSSGVREWDEAVLRAIDRTEVLPRDVDGRVPSSLVIAFRPRDL